MMSCKVRTKLNSFRTKKRSRVLTTHLHRSPGPISSNIHPTEVLLQSVEKSSIFRQSDNGSKATRTGTEFQFTSRFWIVHRSRCCYTRTNGRAGTRADRWQSRWYECRSWSGNCDASCTWTAKAYREFRTNYTGTRWSDSTFADGSGSDGVCWCLDNLRFFFLTIFLLNLENI